MPPAFIPTRRGPAPPKACLQPWAARTNQAVTEDKTPGSRHFPGKPYMRKCCFTATFLLYINGGRSECGTYRQTLTNRHEGGQLLGQSSQDQKHKVVFRADLQPSSTSSTQTPDPD
ncbi:hypothetical protein JOQ06_011443 [Pogonophryne albipinna]|uniref:Uncharacterized protein n=1 Tax=Pogonophryne albipinna TaxID=1090488 RepID=A0AAD6BBE2_9TELE|nr:hypothetical protein JOQ06_011443 [Pogonophryne albipinna]